ncbi:YchJ family protein [Paraburkholderia sp.]|uniref:YchJ family protein n=1 Tax=Paraburkholderia sp. TaxID=1926495 RepID=UPI0023A27863|nr:YchJ family protein [Paraburkholderia sp.]MDE1181037.1 YchJ family protein [Paraburkholderia sp.]
MSQQTLTMQRPADCPCGGVTPNAKSSVKAPRYAQCCGRYIDGGDVAPNAWELMRSRYSAYVIGASDYLRETWTPDTCPASLDVDPDAADSPRWLGLQIKRYTSIDDTHAEVEFIARYKVAGRAHRMHEASRFVRGDDQRWRYVDGVVSDD